MAWECGGGTVLIFLLTSVFTVDQHIAQGANLLFFIPTCIVSAIINMKDKNIETKTAIIVIISGVLGAAIGAKLSVNLSVNNLRKIFGYFLILMSFFEIFSFIKSYIKNKKVHNKNIEN